MSHHDESPAARSATEGRGDERGGTRSKRTGRRGAVRRGISRALLVLVLIAGSWVWAAPARAIVGGVDSATLNGQVQFFVSQAGRIGAPDDYECVGTLIDVRWVLTAKHCITDSGATIYNSGVLVGNRQLGQGAPHTLESIHLNQATDTALIELEDEVLQVNEVVGYGLGTPARGANVAVRGWGSAAGALPRPFLQVATMRVFDTQAPVGPRLVLSNIGQGITEGGDSGAGVWAGRLVYGVVSRGDATTLTTVVPTNDIAPWIQQVTGVGPTAVLSPPPFPSAPDPSVLRIMPVGDSITEGVNSSSGNGYRKPLEDLMKQEGHEVDYVGSHRSGTMSNGLNEGWSGQEIDYIRDKTLANIARYDPNIVTLQAGTNDIGHGREAGAPQRLVDLVHQIRAAVPDAHVLVGDLLVDVNGTTDQKHRAFSSTVRQLLRADGDDHVTAVDMTNLQVSNMGGVHPNDAGYAQMAASWRGAVNRVILDGRLAPRPKLETTSGLPSVPEVQEPAITDITWLAPTEVAAVGVDPGSMQLADLNADGMDDLIIVTKNGNVAAYNSRGGFDADGWTGRGEIAAVKLGPGQEIQFANIDADGRADLLVVNNSTGAVGGYLNKGGFDGGGWTGLGLIASVSTSPGDKISFADINADGKDDFIHRKGGSIGAYLNNGGFSGNGWIGRGEIGNVGVTGTTNFYFPELNDDGRADLVVHDPAAPAKKAGIYMNKGGFGDGGWQGIPGISGGAMVSSGKTLFGDIDGDGRDDLIAITSGGNVRASLNRAS